MKRFRFFGIVFICLWSFSVLYPNPVKFFATLSRLHNPPTTFFVEELRPLIEESFGKNPSEIEEIVKREIPYGFDWELYNLPLYFPTIEEVMEKKAGDCKSQFLVTASIFDFYGIEYSMLFSPVHVWIGYGGRKETRSENKEIVIKEIKEGVVEFRFPEKIDWENSMGIFYSAFWRAMPIEKKIALYLGFFVSLFFFFPRRFL